MGIKTKGSTERSGDLKYRAANDIGNGWLEPNGALISRANYAGLFAAIGTTYGAGDGVTTFKLPDLRAEGLRAWDNGRGVDAGRVFGSSQLDQMQQLTGTMTSQGTQGGTQSGVFTGSATAANNWSGSGGSSTCSGQNYAFNSANSPGARVGTETRMRNVAVLLLIKY